MFAHVKQKLRSQRGASLSMALMLFLVCAVVASIVLAASTAAAGRQSQLEAADKSYFNVTSAAGLFWDELKAQVEVEVTRTCDVERDGEGWKKSSAGAGWQVAIDGKNVDATNPLSADNATLFQLLTCDLLFGTSGPLSESGSGRAPSQGDISKGIDLSKYEVASPDEAVGQEEYAYPTPTVTVEAATGTDGFGVVSVNVTRKDDGTFDFVFSEPSNPNAFTCTITALVSVDASPLRPNSEANMLSGTTTVRWSKMNMRVGG